MKNRLVILSLIAAAAGGSVSGDWDGPGNGNPLVAGYFADPSAFYDSSSKAFYIFSTTDGLWISYSGDPAVYSSTDFVHWKLTRLALPAAWPKQPLWAPSIVKHPENGKYYLMYAIGDGTYIAFAASPLGPWTNATAAGAALYRTGEMWGNNDWFDAQFFVDTATVYMTFGGGGKCGIAKIAFDAEGRASIDNADSRMTDGSKYKFRQLAGLSGYLEGSCMFKKDGRYFLTYSNSACQNYNVRYAVAPSPVGPFSASNTIILRRNSADAILGPGHNSILEYGGSWYIVYHRQHYPYVDVKRQVCIDQIDVDGDAISAGAQTQEGVRKGSGALESLASAHRPDDDADIAFGKSVAASSESDFKGGTSGNIAENFPAIKGFYAGRYAVDRNNGTRWAPGSLPGYLIVDLGKDFGVARCETVFEYVLRVYKYRIECLANAEAASLDAARSSGAWHMFGDRSNNAESVSPAADSGLAIARFVKITVLSADLPTATDEIRTIVQTDYADRAGIVEFRVYGAASSSAIGNSSRQRSAPSLRRASKGAILAAMVNAAGKTAGRRFVPEKRGTRSMDATARNRALSHEIYFYPAESPASPRK